MQLYHLARQRQDRESRLRRDFDKQAERHADRISRSDINWVIMDYLVSEGYPYAAAKFAQETNISQPFDAEAIKARVRVRSAIHAGKVDEAIDMINDIDPEVCSHTIQLHTPFEMIIVSCTTHIAHALVMRHNYNTSVLSMIFNTIHTLSQCHY